MRTGTFGLAQAIPQRPRVAGPSVATLGQQDLSGSTSLLGSAARQGAAMESANANMEQEAKAGNAQLGSTAGAAIGSIWGPAGAAVGGTLGGLIGGLF